MKKINYKSDFDFLLKLVSCVKAEDGSITKTEVGFPDHDWDATFWTSRKSTSFVASRRGDELTNCFNDNGQIHVVCNNRGLGPGVLNVEFHAHIPNTMYPDGCADLYHVSPLDIELVVGQSDCMEQAEVELGLPIMYRSVYEDAVKAGFEGTKEEYYQRLSELPDSVEVATTIRQSVEDINEASKNISAMVADTAAGKKRVLDALARRGYELPTDASYDEIADVIEHMTWGEGILAKIGYEGEEDYEQLSKDIAQSYRAKQLYESGEVDSLYDCGVIAPKVEIKDGNANNLFFDAASNKGAAALKYVPIYNGLTSCKNMFYSNSKLEHAPVLDTHDVVSTRYMYYNCANLKTCPELDLSNCDDTSSMFANCYMLIVGLFKNAGKVANMASMFTNCTALTTISLLDFSNVTTLQNTFNKCDALHTLCIVNFGKSSLTSYPLSTIPLWGATEEGRQSLIDSLITNSYDRAANGLSKCTITLHANVKARLTDEEKASITAKGFTIA